MEFLKISLSVIPWGSLKKKIIYGHTAREILVPQPGIEAMPCALGARVLTTGQSEVPFFFFKKIFYLFEGHFKKIVLIWFLRGLTKSFFTC